VEQAQEFLGLVDFSLDESPEEEEELKNRLERIRTALFAIS
jgi:hypothetical protein